MLLFVILNFIVIIHNTCPLLCYNGTFTFRRYGQDPVTYRGLFGPSQTAVARTRCLLTTQCNIRSAYEALLCYNCSSTQSDWNRCGGDFAPSSTFTFNSTRTLLINCTGENAMCFVRSWTARARHAWIVQRGCYQTTAEDALPRSMTLPTRAMTCKHERHPAAEYKVCLCQADWCNSASRMVPSIAKYFLKLSTLIVGSIIIF